MNILFAGIEGFLHPSQAMLGYYQVAYEYTSNLSFVFDKEKKDADNKVELERCFYAPEITKDKSPIFVTQKVETQGICFTINEDIVQATLNRIQSSDDVRLLLRKKLFRYLILSQAKRYTVFFQTLDNYTEIIAEFFFFEILPKEGFRTLSPNDANALVRFFRDRYFKDSTEVNTLRIFLHENENFWMDASQAFETSFTDSSKYRDFITSVLYHSLASSFKISAE